MDLSFAKVQQGVFQVTASIKKPKHIFLWALNDTKLRSQTRNMFLFNTYNIANGQTIANARLTLGNGVQYPNGVLYPTSEKGRTYNELLHYQSTFSWYLMNPLIYYSNFQTLYGLIYFNLTCTQDIIKIMI